MIRGTSKAKRGERLSDRQRGYRIGRAYQQLRDMIVRGQLPPGTRLVESELVESLGVSRTPIRSALNRLVAEGFVLSSGKSKEFLTVSPLTEADAAELYEMVGYLESIPARKAACLAEAVRAKLGATLQRYNREITVATRSGPSASSGIFELDRLFHQAIIDAGGGPRLVRQLDALKSQVERYDRLYISMSKMGPSLQEHEQIILAVRTGDPDAAEAAVKRNWRNSITRLADVIAAHGERGSWRQGAALSPPAIVVGSPAAGRRNSRA